VLRVRGPSAVSTSRRQGRARTPARSCAGRALSGPGAGSHIVPLVCSAQRSIVGHAGSRDPELHPAYGFRIRLGSPKYSKVNHS